MMLYEGNDFDYEIDDEMIDDEREVEIHINYPYTTVIERNHGHDGIDLIRKRYPFAEEEWLECDKRFWLPDKVVAVVKLADGDTYDEHVGITKAISKLNRIIIGRREGVVKVFENYLKKIVKNPAAKKQI
jgi:hypothetical protein